MFQYNTQVGRGFWLRDPDQSRHASNVAGSPIFTTGWALDRIPGTRSPAG
jgi:hypothetical protein